MAFTTHLLVVANRTVDSPELLDALRLRAESGPIHVTMLAPSTYAERAEAQRRMQRAAANLEAAGIESEAMLGDADPIVAVQEAWDPGRYDEVVVSTLAVGASRWLQIDLPHRVAKLTDCQVRHVVGARAPARAGAPAAPARAPADARARRVAHALGDALRRHLSPVRPRGTPSGACSGRGRRGARGPRGAPRARRRPRRRARRG